MRPGLGLRALGLPVIALSMSLTPALTQDSRPDARAAAQLHLI
jgi:hypothetical protein